jgi:MFS transporter, NNP family, nitrate/nitrite transporter
VVLSSQRFSFSPTSENVTPSRDSSLNTSSARPTFEAHGQQGSAAFRHQLGPIYFLVLIFLLNFIGRIIFSPILPAIEKELTISHGRAGSLFLLISAGYLIGLLGSGFLVSRSTHKQVIVVSAAGVGTSLVAVSLAAGFWTIGLALIGLGVAAGLYMPSAVATITSLVDRQHWGKAIAVHELAPNVAFFVGPFVAELFLRWSSWRMALGFLGALSLALSAAYRRFGRGGEFSGASPASRAFQTLLGSASLWLMVVLFGAGVSSTIGVYAMLPLYLINERQMEPSWSNTLLALSRSYAPILGLSGGWVSDWLGPKQTMVVSLVFTGAATLLLGIVPLGWMDAAILVQPVLAVWFFPAVFAALSVITSPAARNLAVAVTVPFGYVIGGGAIPTLIGIAGDAGSFAFGFIVTGAFITLGGVSALLLKLPEVDKTGN